MGLVALKVPLMCLNWCLADVIGVLQGYSMATIAGCHADISVTLSVVSVAFASAPL